jgi:DNA modification methylase
MKLKDIKPNPNNPRVLRDDKFQKLKQSIAEFPKMLSLRPMVIDENNVVLGGNMRLRALQELGFTDIDEAWVKRSSDLTEEEKKRFVIADNVAFGEWDWDTLANDWDVVDLEAWGLDIPQFDTVEELEASEDDYDVPEGGIETDIVIGDLFEIGKHRLLCGDSTDSDAVARLMNGEKADLGHNDPPYGMKKENEGVLNDNLNFDNLLQFNKEWIALQFIHLKDSGSWYCWGIDEPLMDIYSHILKPYIKEQKATFRNLITWDKKNPSGKYDGNGIGAPDARMFAMLDEKCLFVMKGVQGFNNNADNYFNGWDSIVNYLDEEKNKAKFTIKDCKRLAGHSEKSGCHWFDKSQWMMPTKETYDSWRNNCIENNVSAFKKEYEELKKEYEELKKEYYTTRAYFNNTHDLMTNIWNFIREKDRSHGHATPKPIPLCERVIKSSCPENGLVLDFFLGSGSTMVAAHQLKRKCYGMEIEPKYCQVIIDRMRKLDSSLIIKRNGIELKTS